MGKIYQCTIRPFDCKYYMAERHRCGNDDGNAIEICKYAKEMPVLADDIEPDMIDREILANMRRRAAEQQGFMYDPTVKDEVQEEGERIVKLFDYVLKQEHMKKGEEPEYTGRDTGFDVNHELPEKIIALLDVLQYEKKGFRYYGIGQNTNPTKSLIEFGVDGNMLICKNISILKIIFTVDVSIGAEYLLVLMQAYGIVHHRYIYERIDAAYEDFWDNQEQ